MMEQTTEPPRTKSRPNTTCGNQTPEEKTVPGGTFVLGGAKSLSEREPTYGLEMGALDSGIIGKDLIGRRKKVSRGNLTEGQEIL